MLDHLFSHCLVIPSLPSFEELTSKYPITTCLLLHAPLCSVHTSLHPLHHQAMPTFTFYRKGKQVQKLVGADPTKLSTAVATLKK